MGNEPKVYRAKISDLKTLGEKNPNKGTERGVYAVEKSLEKFGAWRSIAVAQDGQVVAGNHTLEAYAAAGNEDVLVVETDGTQLIVVKRTDITGDDQRAQEYAIADNRSSELGLEWDAAQIQALLDQDLNLSDWFQQDELAELLAGLDLGGGVGDDPGADVDRAGELRVKWQTAHGQVWEIPSLATLGRNHRVMCGDSTSAEDVARLMGGEKVNAVATDPPYGIGVDKSMHEKGGQQYGNAAAPKNYYPNTNWDNEIPSKEFFDWLLENAKELIIWGGNYFPLPPTRCVLVWDKQNDGNQFSDCELAWTNLDKPVRMIRHLWNGMLRKDGEDRLPHPTQKPVEVIKWAIELLVGRLIFDPFLGSGTTLVACEQTGRIGYGMEIAPDYVAVILERLSGMGLAPRVVE